MAIDQLKAFLQKMQADPSLKEEVLASSTADDVAQIALKVGFDEYYNIEGWEEYEYKAFQELVNYNDMSYEYTNDCLTAGLVYRREFYEDNDLEPKDTLMFTITFVPLAGVKTPLINP